MKRMKLLSVAAMVLVMIVVSACGNNANNTGSSNTGATEKPAANEGEKDITITMMVSGNRASEGEDFEMDVLPKLIKEKFPNITLEVQKLPDDQYNTSIRTKLAAGQGPDIFTVFPKNSTSGVNDFAKANFLSDLSDLTFWDKIAPGAKDDMSYDGKTYAVTKGSSYLGTYYNKEMLESVGVTEFPKDWDSFLELCQKLVDAGITPIVMGDKDPWVIQFGMYQIAANVVYPGELDFDEKLQRGENSLTNEKWVAAIEKYGDLYRKGYVVKNSLGIGSAQANQLFIDGQAAMIFTGTWDAPSLTSQGAANFTRGFDSLPGNNAGDPVFVSAATSAGYGVNAKSKYVDEVKAILNFWFDGESELFKSFNEHNTDISVYEGVELNNELFTTLHENYSTTGNSVYFSNQMWPSGVSDVMQSKFAEIIGGRDITGADVAKAMDDKFKELWKN